MAVRFISSRFHFAFAWILAVQSLFAGAPSADKSLKIEIGSERGPAANRFEMKGSDARVQLLATANDQAGVDRDRTGTVSWKSNPAGIVDISKNGVMTPVHDGEAVVTAKTETGLNATVPVRVQDSQASAPINFSNEIVPIFTKAGCNAGGCHGKSSGQNGFKLSLLGFEPSEDFEHLTREARGRRLFPAAPAQSLLLLKATGALPHGGGQKLEKDSADYKKIYRWIAQGMPYGSTNDATIASIEVWPKQRILERNSTQQLVVTARYTDGSSEDVTSSALFEANDKEMAEVNSTGLVTAREQPGQVAVMIRYRANVAVFQATIPLGAPITSFPVAKNFIDEEIFKKLKLLGLPPSQVCDDATFIRRVTLDISGRLPTATETKHFLENKESNKRDRAIDALLGSTDYAEYFANKWNSLLRNRRNDAKYTRGSYAFHSWIRDSLIENKPYDKFVRDILTASGDITENPPVAWFRQVKDMNGEMEDVAQLFLGQKMQCAQCHHHPFEKWSQNDYYSFTAFFSRVGRKAGAQPGEEFIYHKRGTAEATQKKTKQSLKPAGLGSGPLAVSADDDPREALAQWMTDPKNPYFAKALVNRYWKHFFNRGLVDPEDDLRETNPPSHPELLNALAAHFRDSGFDLKALVRTICSSQTYQLSSLPNAYNATDKQSFSRFYPRRLPAEVLFDSISAVTASDTHFDGLPTGTRAIQLPDNSFNANYYFLSVFGRPEGASSCECERSSDSSLAQCLHLLNSKTVQDKVSASKGRAEMLATDKSRSDESKISELYSIALSRDPDASELSAAKEYIAKIQKKVSEKPEAKDKEDAKESKDTVAVQTRQAYEDLVWALLNTKEFLFNH